ncbi:sigma-70 family RNA polymerase sigma factor [Paenibacillus sp. sptzw28]|uniref:sigma-70 family RNA polymerase sigma factor n=1 Tax=Paenibacillus sp. sptzw28 TaxID=715179 RepID=UPI001C6DEF92|nr:sigma-70 family RNA polymerase sigma factor [Paenibacillus sp. sptzw28]QYR22807.1 sigma-70 family RNA polymerase sigma factor [Paenibacillus sp. sptzw28]
MIRPAGPNEKSSFPENPSSALEMMMEHYGSAVLRTAYFYLGDRHLAEDVSQEVFIRAFRNWAAFRGDSSVKTWLTRITINLCRDKLGLKAMLEQPTDPLLLQRTESYSVEEEALERLNRTEILRNIAKLPAHYHEVIYLFYYLDLATREIAEVTESPEGTVRGRLHRARELLGQYLVKEGLTQ